jgi:2-oxoglutarate ferredoxin oxidoreductase subunit alpha
MAKNDVFTLKIGGQAGQGIKSTGLLFARFAKSSGFHVYTDVEYPSIIRGGHNVMQINFGPDPITAAYQKTDFLIALNQDTVNKHHQELTSTGAILFDADRKFDTSAINSAVTIFPVPLSRLAKEVGGTDLYSDTVAMGAVVAILGGQLSILKNLLHQEFLAKGEQVVTTNQTAAEAGYNFVGQNFASQVNTVLTVVSPSRQLENCVLMAGKDTAALGAIAAGLQFAAIYPMSPTTDILEILALHQEKYGYIYKQPEDEISAINMAIGASFAGARAMVATSGGGFALMSEGYGLAGMTETPLVIIEGMRGGPATGLPTWNGQGDLQMVLYAHQEDFPRIVIAPGDAEETIHIVMEAFNLADKYQTAVVVLVDKNILGNEQTMPAFDLSSYQVDRGKFDPAKMENYQRYLASEDGISVRTVPGSGNFMIANSDEHDPTGYSSEEIVDRTTQMDKRMKKLATCAAEDMLGPVIFGPAIGATDLTIVSWGSNKGVILQAIKEYPNVNYMHINWMNPFPAEEVAKVLNGSDHVLDIEANYNGQLAELIRKETGIEITDRLLKYDGRPFYTEEIKAAIETRIT